MTDLMISVMLQCTLSTRQTKKYAEEGFSTGSEPGSFQTKHSHRDGCKDFNTQVKYVV